ncbi:MAG TPA: YdcF family protein [Methylibium sp.]
MARALKSLALLAAACYLIAAGVIAAAGLQDHLEPADAIVVFGNAVAADGTPSRRLGARLDGALEVYRRGLASLVIVSGGIDREGHDEAATMARYLEDRGIPRSAIVQDNAGKDTMATAADVARIASERRLESVIVATQYFHVPRARLALMRAGLRVVGSVHARYFEARDFYSLAREVVGFAAYYVGLRSPAERTSS